MEDDTRRFQPASIGMFSIETGKERYTSDGRVDAPTFSSWRNNVTALSHRHNLYFVAMRDCIAVFVPRFPYQKLGRTPALVITPTLANKGAHGYINQALPHAINHLLVGDLGSEEVLLVARDSGNVDAYYTRAVSDAIEREPERFNKDRHADYVGLRAFFSQWVHESAWGLAIHKEARMIAVSANTPFHVASEDLGAKITVFAFALSTTQSSKETNSDADQESTEVESEWRVWEPKAAMRSTQTAPSRKNNYKIVLDRGHANNIPSICFVNTNDDQAGTWLFSTDIEGKMIGWSIWQKKVVNTWTMTSDTTDGMPFRIGRGNPVSIRGVARRIDGETDRGWLVAALDPRAFAVANDIAEFCGAPTLIDPQQRSFGVTDIAGSSVPGNSQSHPQYEHLEANSDSDLSAEFFDEDGDEDFVDDMHSLDQDTVEAISDLTEHSATRATFHDTLHAPLVMGNEALEVMEDEDVSASNDHDRELDHFSRSTGSSTSLSSLNPPVSGKVGKVSKGLLRSASEDEQELEAYGAGHMTGAKPQARSLPGSRLDIQSLPTFPLLHCSVSHVRLFNAPFARQAHWYCGDLLTQMVPDDFAQTRQYALDRLNMIQQIPELGLVIIASQSGRCAVCSTMRMTEDGPLGLRIDWVLPTKKQEKAGLRPPYPLLGIAVGPIQGMLKNCDYDNPAEDENFDDRTINGTPTSFDESVIVMESGEEDSPGGDFERDVKRLRALAQPATACEPREENRTWPQSGSIESWRGVDYSRRFRLMLTYEDWTILTYELAREAPYTGLTRQGGITATDRVLTPAITMRIQNLKGGKEHSTHVCKVILVAASKSLPRTLHPFSS